ncbi:MAG: cell division protein FtsQ/DivIB [Myxococcota bacterium]|nr:cell division protein FtsQ/DivIB [Myxococcota bacterium]
MNDLYDRSPTLARRALRVLGWGFGGGLVVTVLGVAGHNLVEGEAFRVQRVVFDGTSHATETELRHLADIPTDAHLFEVDLGLAVRGMETHPWVKQATATRSFPGTVEVLVEEYEPVLLLALDQLWYVDADGTPFKRARSNDMDYPVLTGINHDLVTDRAEVGRAQLWGALRILAAFEQTDFVSVDEISEVHLDRWHGYEVVLRSGTRLVLGNQEPTPRLARLERLLESGLNLERPQRIDLDVETVAIASPLSRSR